MKYRVMDLLCCPKCGYEFELKVFRTEEAKNGETFKVEDMRCTRCFFEEKGSCSRCYNTEIVEGALLCKCGEVYPIVKSIPRILSNALLGHSNFLQRYEDKLPKVKISGGERRKLLRDYQQTKKRFEFQWSKFGEAKKIYGRNKKEELDFFFSIMCPDYVDSKFLEKKLLLDGGCGHGRYVQSLSEGGAEVVGVDIGLGVEVAGDRIKDIPNAHVIQTNVMELPFKDRKFDLIYCIGVIHHTPNPRRSFGELARLVKKGGIYTVWVYPKESWWWEVSQRGIRKITTRLPPWLLYYLSYIPVPILYYFRPYSGTYLGKNTWKECVQCIYDWFSPEFQTHHTNEEIARWFMEEGFTKIKALPLRAGGYGVKKN